MPKIKVLIQSTITYEVMLNEPNIKVEQAGSIALLNDDLWEELEVNSFVYNVEEIV